MTQGNVEGSAISPLEILLVEDNPGDVELTQRILRDSEVPLNISVAKDGEVAMAHLRKEDEHVNSPRPDYIILDLNMPKKNGYEVIAEINTDSDLKLIPIMILTSTQAEEDQLQFRNIHPSNYCSKPLELSRFNQAINLLRSESYLSWWRLADLGGEERESSMGQKYKELAGSSPRERSSKMKDMVRAEYDLSEEKLHPFNISRLQAWLKLDSAVAERIVSSYNEGIGQMASDILERRAALAPTLSGDFSEEERERLIALDPGVFSAASPQAQEEAQQQEEGADRTRKWWWPFGNR